MLKNLGLDPDTQNQTLGRHDAYPAGEECPKAEAPPRRRAPRRCHTARGTCQTPQTGSGTRTRSPATVTDTVPKDDTAHDTQSHLCFKKAAGILVTNLTRH